jgi:hypothetical protein
LSGLLVPHWTLAQADINRDSAPEPVAGVEFGVAYDAEGWRSSGSHGGRFLELLSVEIAVDGNFKETGRQVPKRAAARNNARPHIRSRP